MAAESPCFRAAWPKFTLATLKRYPHDDRARIIEAITPDLRDEIRAPASLAWQDAAVFMQLCGQISSCGETIAQAFWRYSLLASIKQPLIGTLVEGGMALWGRSPAALYARTPRAWGLISRGCGEMRMEPGRHAQEAHVFAQNLPAVCRKHDGIVRMWQGGFRGQADFVGCEAEVATDTSDFVQNGNLRFTLRW